VVPPCSDRISRVPPYSWIHHRITRTGLSPLRPCFPDRFRLSLMYHWPGPRSLALLTESRLMSFPPGTRCFSSPGSLKTSYEFRDFIPSLDNWKSKTLRLGLKHCCSNPKIQDLGVPAIEGGFPHSKSVDQSFFAAPHGLSQRSTSFIASQRQGIHRTPLRHLIALIINVHTLGRM